MSIPEISINLDTKCTQCGAKGAAQNGLCLKCITKKITKEGIMSERKIVKLPVDKLSAKVKMIEIKEEGAVVERRLITEATIQYEGTPAKLDYILWLLQGGQSVEVTFSSPQFSMEIKEAREIESKEPAMAN